MNASQQKPRRLQQPWRSQEWTGKAVPTRSRKRLYDCNRWKAASRHYLSRHPICYYCQWMGLHSPSVHTDHIRRHQGNAQLFWNRANWQPLCADCHAHKTYHERIGLGITWTQRTDRYVLSGEKCSGKSTAAWKYATRDDDIFDFDRKRKDMRLPNGELPRSSIDAVLAIREKMIDDWKLNRHRHGIIIVHNFKQAHRIARSVQATWIDFRLPYQEQRRRESKREIEGQKILPRLERDRPRR